MRRVQIALILMISILVISGCNRPESAAAAESGTAGGTGSATAVSSGPSRSDVANLGPVEALALANRWKGNDVTTFVTTESVNFEFKNGDKASVRLPSDEMVVAIAPYVDTTHPCEIHYMSGCQGELVGVPVAVKATLGDGTVLVDDTVRTMSNGFLELWLPRNVEIAITMTAQGKTVSGTIGTFGASNTCITTLQLT